MHWHWPHFLLRLRERLTRAQQTQKNEPARRSDKRESCKRFGYQTVIKGAMHVKTVYWGYLLVFQMSTRWRLLGFNYDYFSPFPIILFTRSNLLLPVTLNIKFLHKQNLSRHKNASKLVLKVLFTRSTEGKAPWVRGWGASLTVISKILAVTDSTAGNTSVFAG